MNGHCLFIFLLDCLLTPVVRAIHPAKLCLLVTCLLFSADYSLQSSRIIRGDIRPPFFLAAVINVRRET